MALQKALVEVPIGGGLGQKADPKALPPGKLLSARNIAFSKQGAYEKRRGFTSLTTTLGGVPLASGDGKVFEHQGQAMCIDGQALGAYAATHDTDLVANGEVPEAQVSRLPVSHGVDGAYNPDVAAGNGVVVLAYAAPYALLPNTWTVMVTVYDETSGVELFSQKALGTATGSAATVRACFVGTTGMVFWSNGANIVAATLLPDLTWTTPANIITDNKYTTFDVCALTDRFAVVSTKDVAGVGQIKVSTFTSALALLATANTFAVIAPHATYAATRNMYGIGGSLSGTLWVSVWAGGAFIELRMIGLNPVTLAVTTATVLLYTAAVLTARPGQTSVLPSSTTVATVAAEITIDGDDRPNLLLGQIDTAGTLLVDPDDHTTGWCALASKLFVHDGRVYVWAYAGAARVTGSRGGLLSLVLLQLVGHTVPETPRPVGVCAPRFAYQPASPNLATASACVLSNGKYLAAAQIRYTAAQRPGIAILGADFAATSRWLAAPLGLLTHLSGGLTSYFDGRMVAEAGYIFYPERATLTSANTGGASMAAGDYSYVFVYAWVDASGNVHRSAPSLPQTVTVAPGDNSVTILAPALTLTRRQLSGSVTIPTVHLEVYRTVAGGAGSYYRVFDPGDRSTRSFPTLDVLALTDVAADSSITTRPLLYTTGGVVANMGPPASHGIAAYRNRLFVIGDDRLSLYFSKRAVAGEGPAFSDLFVLPLSEPATALAVLDDKLVIFSEASIFVLVGDGPSDTNVGSDYTDPQRVSADAGCIDPRSVVATPNGVMFQSHRGIYLLDRSMQLSYIGADVEDTLAAYPTITSAVLVPDVSEVRFTCIDTLPINAGVTLVYNYWAGQWSLADYYDPLTGLPYAPVRAAALVAGVYHWLGDSGALYRESAESWLDAGHWVTMDLEFSWGSFSGLQGYQRVWNVGVLGERFSNHTLTIQIGTDYAAAYEPQRTWPASTIDVLPLERLRVHVQRQKASSVRVRVTDGPPESGIYGTGRGCALSGLAFEIGKKIGLHKQLLPEQSK